MALPCHTDAKIKGPRMSQGARSAQTRPQRRDLAQEAGTSARKGLQGPIMETSLLSIKTGPLVLAWKHEPPQTEQRSAARKIAGRLLL